jgi:hypothetical protein
MSALDADDVHRLAISLPSLGPTWMAEHPRNGSEGAGQAVIMGDMDTVDHDELERS